MESGLGLGVKYSDTHFMTLAQAKSYYKSGAGVGMQGRNNPAVDIDENDPELSHAIVEFTELHLGFAPVRTRDSSARCLMVYKRGAEFLYKRRLEYEKRDGKRGAVELLGKGQYYNVAGPHPKGGYYGWRHGQSPVEWGPDRLSEITPEDADQYFADLQKFLGERGCKIIESSSSSGGGARSSLMISGCTRRRSRTSSRR